MEDALFRGNREPSLDQILAEPIVRLVMRRDGVDETTIRRLMQNATAALPAKIEWITATAGAPSPAQLPSSTGVAAQSAATPPWPRVFPSL